MFKSQLELESYILKTGRDKAQRVMDMNEEKGRADLNVYADTLFRKYTIPLSKLIQEDIDNKKPGPHKAHVKFLEYLDVEASAYITIRSTFAAVMSETMFEMSARRLASVIGNRIYSELLLRSYKKANPEHYYIVTSQLKQRHSLDIKHRMSVVKADIKRADETMLKIDSNIQQKIGMYLIEKLRQLGFLEVKSFTKNNDTKIEVLLSADVLALVSDMREFVEENTPYSLACVEKPQDWTTLFNGGYHSDDMKKVTGPVVDGFYIPKEENLGIVLQAINVLQSVKYQINHRIFDVVNGMFDRGIVCDEIIIPSKLEKPKRLEFLEHKNKEEFTDEEKKQFLAWKKSVKHYHEQLKKDTSNYIRMMGLINVCNMFKDYSEIYFVYKTDFRGRVYPYTTGINPQGSDLQKAVLQFAEAKPVKTEDAKKWFLIQGANKYGVDKESYEDRIKWVKENERFIIDFATDPLSNRDWLNADKPFQFLAWCFEYKDFVEMGPAFVSRLPISMDGSCNGLQHLSASLRDEVGGKATNLTASSKPQDIYGIVAKETESLLSAMPEDEDGFRSKWLKHKITRKIVKRSVMTMPYGSTRFSSRDFILDDYMNVYHPEEFEKDEYPRAALFLSHIVWSAIAKVVIKGREAMDWLQDCATKIIKSDQPYIEWIAPSGMKIRQDYRKFKLDKRIEVELYGGTKISIQKEQKEACASRHKNGIAPNFIHSLDASHMQRVILKAHKLGMKSFAMIHDDFGTHAADSEAFSKIIREEFVNMYEENDWFKEFSNFYTSIGIELKQPPSFGDLKLAQVIDSPYFFG